MSDLTHQRLIEVLDYDPLTGVWRWLVTLSIRRVAGSIAGSDKGSHRYLSIQIDGKRYLGHRLALFYVNGVWPVAQVDHIDVTRGGGFKNLREADNSQNHANIKTLKSNTSGFKGVVRDKRCPKRPWIARIVVRGKRFAKGYFETAEEAHAAYMNMATEHFGEFARGS